MQRPDSWIACTAASQLAHIWSDHVANNARKKKSVFAILPRSAPTDDDWVAVGRLAPSIVLLWRGR